MLDKYESVPPQVQLSNISFKQLQVSLLIEVTYLHTNTHFILEDISLKIGSSWH